MRRLAGLQSLAGLMGGVPCLAGAAHSCLHDLLDWWLYCNCVVRYAERRPNQERVGGGSIVLLSSSSYELMHCTVHCTVPHQLHTAPALGDRSSICGSGDPPSFRAFAHLLASSASHPRYEWHHQLSNMAKQWTLRTLAGEDSGGRRDW